MSLIPAECAAMSSRLYFRCTRLSDGNCRPTQAPGRHSWAGRIGRGTKPPPQFGQTLCSFVSTQSAQNVHSYEQMRASVEAGGRSLSQYSQFGRSCSAMAVTSFVAEAKFSCILFELRTSPLPLWERSDRIVRCDPGEGLRSIDRPEPLTPTLSRKGRGSALPLPKHGVNSREQRRVSIADDHGKLRGKFEWRISLDSGRANAPRRSAEVSNSPSAGPARSTSPHPPPPAAASARC